jgi:hypothetical protein
MEASIGDGGQKYQRYKPPVSAYMLNPLAGLIWGYHSQFPRLAGGNGLVLAQVRHGAEQVFRLGQNGVF